MPIRRFRPVAIAIAAAALIAAPASARKPPPGFDATPPPLVIAPPPEDGGIFHVSQGYAALHVGTRARGVGDPLTIYLLEKTTTGKDASSNTSRAGGFSIVPPSAGLFSFLNPNALKASGGSSFKGQGNAGQSSTLVGQVGVTIVEVRPNGTALVKGEKRMLLSQGQEWIQFSGIVRLADIDADNGIASSRVANAHIEYAGNGAIQRAGREGWLSHFFNIVSPF